MKYKLTTLLPVLGAGLLLIAGSSCKKDASANENSYTVFKEVSYGASAAEKMDIYLPAGHTAANTPAIVLIHGGAWVSGDKAEFSDAVTALQSHLGDYALFNINYRLLGFDGTNPWPTQLNDVEAAIDFIVSQAETYRFNPDKLVIVGASAGAHLGLLKAYSRNTGGRIKAVIDLFGPVDMKDLYNNPADPVLPTVLDFFLNGTPVSSPAIYEAASPLYQVTPDAPPTLIFHGQYDPLVPVKQSESLHNRLLAAGVPTDLIIYPDEGHGWTGRNLADTYVRAAGFIRQQVQ